MAFWQMWRAVAEQQVLQQQLLTRREKESERNRQSAVNKIWHSETILDVTDHVARWEALPLTGDVVETEDGQPLGQDNITQDDEEKKEDAKFNPIKLLKIAVPHIILLSVLLSYLAAGAAILQRLENGTEITRRYNKLVELDKLFKWVVNETWRLHELGGVVDFNEWNEEVYDRLQNISLFYYKRRTRDQAPLETIWTFPTAILYTLTVLTACGKSIITAGYSHIDPVTEEGMVFAVAFALLGIPLMFITAADIGKFLSETFVNVVQFSTSTYKSFMWKFFPKYMKEREKAAAAAKAAQAAMDELDPERMLSGESGGSMESLWLPIGGYLFSMCLYCSIGAIIFRSYEPWGFIHAFHFAFNTVVTVGMGEVVVNDVLYLCMIVAYVIIGLAVVTMCVDLASSHLQKYFQKIHYFGRARKRFFGMSDEIKEMMGLIAAMRKKKGGKVTWNDLKQYLEEGQTSADGRARAFCPRNVHLWKYVDETSSAISTYRHNSVNSCSSASSASAPPRRHYRGGGGASSGHHHPPNNRASLVAADAQNV